MIHLGARYPKAASACSYTTVLHRWFEDYRPHLMQSISYAPFEPAGFGGLVPKINTQALSSAFAALFARPMGRLESALAAKPTKHPLYFKKSAYNWLTFCRALPPCYGPDGTATEHTKFGEVWFATAEMRNIALLFLNGKIMFGYWCMLGDDFDLTKWMFASFPFDLATGVQPYRATLGSV